MSSDHASRYRRRFQTALLLLVAATLLASSRPASALSYDAMSPVAMTVHADVVAVGTLGQTDYPGPDERRTGRWPKTRRFTAERILKGTALAAGAATDVDEEWISGPMHREAGPVRVLIWLRAGAGNLRLIQFSNSVKEPTPGLVTAVESTVAVLAEPSRFLDTNDPVQAEALCHVIVRAWPRQAEWAGPGATRPAEAPAVDGITRERAVAFLARVVLKPPAEGLRTLAARSLAGFKSPAAYDALLAALSIKDEMTAAAAARGLRLLADRRAGPALLRYLDENPHATSGAREACLALAAMNEPAVVPALLKRLARREYDGTIEALQQLRDPRALPPLLEALWADGYTFEAVLSFDDPSILRQAWERAYDHPQAPAVLAARGDPAAKPFMLKLIRQCDATGLTWARKTKDPEAVAATIEAMRRADDPQFLMNAYSVVYQSDDPRAGGAIARLLPFRSHDAYAFPPLERLLGLPAGRPAGGPPEPDPAAHRARARRVYEGVLAAADRIDLDPRTRAWVAAALTQSDDRAATYKLPAWPDAYDPDAVRAFVAAHRDAIRRLALDPVVPPEPRSTAIILLISPDANGGPAFDRDDLRRLLADPDVKVQIAALDAYDRLDLEPDADTLRGLSGSVALRIWLSGVARKQKCAHPEVLQELIESDAMAGSRELHAALRAVKPKSAIPRLVALLSENAIDVRREAAVTLAHLGDARGRAVLEAERRRYAGQKFQFMAWGDEVSRALRRLDAGY